jgi:hypothetical protein
MSPELEALDQLLGGDLQLDLISKLSQRRRSLKKGSWDFCLAGM